MIDQISNRFYIKKVGGMMKKKIIFIHFSAFENIEHHYIDKLLTMLEEKKRIHINLDQFQ